MTFVFGFLSEVLVDKRYPKVACKKLKTEKVYVVLLFSVGEEFKKRCGTFPRFSRNRLTGREFIYPSGKS